MKKIFLIVMFIVIIFLKIKTTSAVQVTIDYGKSIGTSNLKLAAHDGSPHVLKSNDPLLIEKVKNVDFKMFRVELHTIKTCSEWNNATHTCNVPYDWTDFDKEVNAIKNNFPGVIIQFSHIGVTRSQCFINQALCEALPGFPKPFPWNATGDFPAPEDYSQWFSDIVKHVVSDLGISPVQFEVMNEPPIFDSQRALEYLNLYEKTRKKVNETLSSIGKELGKDVLLGINHIDKKTDSGAFFDYALNHYAEWTSVHQYSGWGTSMYPSNKSNVNNVYYPPNDQNGWLTDKSALFKSNRDTISPFEIISRYPSWSSMKDAWENKWGKDLDIMNSETNLNAWWVNGTDPRQQKMFNVIDHTVKMKNYALNGFSYYTFFTIGSWTPQTPMYKYGGNGYGMINATAFGCDPSSYISLPYIPTAPFCNPTPPYWLAYLWGNYIPNGSTIYDSTSSNSDTVDALAVKNQNYYNILLINKLDSITSVQVSVSSVSPETVTLYTLDDSSFKANPESAIRITTLPKSNVQDITFNGYTVAMLQLSPEEAPKCPTCSPCSDWSSCVDDKQNRTCYYCNITSGYICKSYIEEKSCELPKCPTCPPCGNWSSCINNTQTRTCHYCNATSGYICKSYAEKKYCELPKECPTCSQPSAWSECMDEKQNRTNYRCGPLTNYECEPFIEQQDCEIPEEKRAPIEIYILIGVIGAVSIVALSAFMLLKFKAGTKPI